MGESIEESLTHRGCRISSIFSNVTNNAKLKDSIFGVDGKTVDGYITKDGITINVNSPRYINTVVGHEITHVLEDTKLYDALETAVIAYAKEKGTYRDVVKATYDLYSGVEGYTGTEGHRKIKREAVANMVGDYLFTDKNFIHHLAAKNPNIFQKAWNEIKYMIKIAAAGSNEKKKLLQVQKVFEDAYHEAIQKAGKTEQSQEQKNTAEDGGVKYSYSKPNFTKEEWAIINHKKYSEFDNPKYDLDNDTKWMYFNKNGTDVFVVYSKSDVDDPTLMYWAKGKKAEGDYANLTDYLSGRKKHGKQNRTALDRLLRDIENQIVVESASVYPVGRGQPTAADVQVPFGESGSERYGDFGDGAENLQGTEVTEYNEEASAEEQDASFATFSNDYAFYRNFMKEGDTGENGVKYSLSRADSDYLDAANRGDMKTAQKMVDEAAKAAGYTVKAYHGTDAEAFTVFDKSRIGEASGLSILGDGFYFSDKKSVAAQYGKNVYTVYLKQQNPYSATDSDTYKLNALKLDREGFDGVTLPTGKGTVYMVLDPEQVKSAEPVTYDDNGNVIPLSERFKPDNPDMRYSLSDEAALPTRGGNYHISGEEVAFDDLLPMAEKWAQTNAAVSQTNAAEANGAVLRDIVAEGLAFFSCRRYTYPIKQSGIPGPGSRKTEQPMGGTLMKCGYCRKEITPPIGQYMSGKAVPRISQGVEDPLYVRALAFEEGKTAVVMVFDFAGMRQELYETIRIFVAERMGLDREDILISCTHTHTGPVLFSDMEPTDEDYVAALPLYALAAAQGAVADLREATMLGAQDVLEKISFVRRFRMKDGTVRTNPGRNNPDVLEPMSPADETIRLVRFLRECADEILLVNFQVHPDVMNTDGYSADYPGIVCNTLERALPGSKCIYFNGIAGDLNHIDIHCPAWDPNTGPVQAQHMGLSIAGKALSMYAKARPIAAGPVRTKQLPLTIHLRAPEPERVPESREIVRLHEAGLDEQLPYTGMELVTAYFEARQIIERSQPGYRTEKTVIVSGLAVGELCVVGLPGEPFCDIGRQIREESPFAMQLTLGICNGYEGYFPTADAFEVNGYESRTSRFVPGVGEAMAEAGKTVTKALYN